MKFLGWHNFTDALPWLTLLGRLLTAAGLGCARDLDLSLDPAACRRAE